MVHIVKYIKHVSEKSLFIYDAWDGVVTKYHRNYLKELNITPTIEAYIQSTVLKKTLETISLEYRRNIEDSIDVRDRVEDAGKRFGEASATECNRRPSKRKIKNNTTLTL
ncbi:hypothetical protein TCON_0635 [Astathelohania contejeani]|uniref:Uncharacterized protein n=1 Tax=Astathelohania contejeani TaxID=164912 RepID=A0ABQ7I158_9MICR|nr:hypothetical protein TCON_0635 [Thelohania contejeani]